MAGIDDGQPLHDIIAMLYRNRGPDFIRDIKGDFGLAIWDEPAKVLTLSVDYVGFSQMFFRASGGRIHFGSTIAQLKTNQSQINPIHVMMVLTSLFSGPVPTRSTAFSDISRVVPGTFVRIQPDSAPRRTRYWSTRYLPTLAPAKIKQDYAEALRSLVFDAVGRYTAAATEGSQARSVAVGFSGGLDSSTIYYVLEQISQQLGILPATITLRSKSLSGDEEYQTLVETLPLARRQIVSTDTEARLFTANWDEAPHTDEPSLPILVAPNTLNALATAAARLGASVILYGMGGDTLWEGSLRWIGDAIRRAQIIRAWNGILQWGRTSNRSYYSVAAQCFADAINRGSLGHFFRPTLAPWINRSKFDLFRDGIMQQLSDLDFGPSTYANYLYSKLQLENCIGTRNEYVFFENGLREVNPLFYRPLVEFMLTVPPEINYHIDQFGNRITKMLLRESMRGVVPAHTLNRTTKGMPSQLTSYVDALPWFERLLGGPDCRLVAMGLVDRRLLSEYIRRWTVGVDTDWAEITVATEMWLRQNS